MKLWPTYSSDREAQLDTIAGFFTSLLVNASVLVLTESGYLSRIMDANLINLLPWVINGLFLAVFMLILPRFALGYLLAIAIVLAVPLIGGLLFLVGCFLIIFFGSIAELIMTSKNPTKIVDIAYHMLAIAVAVILIWPLAKLIQRIRKD